MAKRIRIRKLAWAAARQPGPRQGTERRRERLGNALTEAVAGPAARLLPLVALLDALQPQLGQESVFRTRRKLLRAHWDAAYAELQAEYPRHRVLVHAFGALADVLRAEARDISPEQWQQAAKELALATLRNAPALLSAARQAQLLQ